MFPIQFHTWEKVSCYSSLLNWNLFSTFPVDSHKFLLICSYILYSLLTHSFMYISCVCSVTKQQKKRKWERERVLHNNFKQKSHSGWRCWCRWERIEVENKLQVVCKQKCWLNLTQWDENLFTELCERQQKWFKFSVTNFYGFLPS